MQNNQMQLAKEIIKDIETIDNAYNIALDAILHKFQTEILNPWCKKKGWKFFAGMGTWNFNDATGEYVYETDARIPAYIRNTLTTVVYNQDLGSLLKDSQE